MNDVLLARHKLFEDKRLNDAFDKLFNNETNPALPSNSNAPPLISSRPYPPHFSVPSSPPTLASPSPEQFAHEVLKILKPPDSCPTSPTLPPTGSSIESLVQLEILRTLRLSSISTSSPTSTPPPSPPTPPPTNSALHPEILRSHTHSSEKDMFTLITSKIDTLTSELLLIKEQLSDLQKANSSPKIHSCCPTLSSRPKMSQATGTQTTQLQTTATSHPPPPPPPPPPPTNRTPSSSVPSPPPHFIPQPPAPPPTSIPLPSVPQPQGIYRPAQQPTGPKNLPLFNPHVPPPLFRRKLQPYQTFLPTPQHHYRRPFLLPTPPQFSYLYRRPALLPTPEHIHHHPKRYPLPSPRQKPSSAQQPSSHQLHSNHEPHESLHEYSSDWVVTHIIDVILSNVTSALVLDQDTAPTTTPNEDQNESTTSLDHLSDTLGNPVDDNLN